MKLRQRIALALLVITIVLIAPAAYGLFALQELQNVATSLRVRDAVGALTLGRLQTAFGEVEQWERVYLALGAESPEARGARERVQENIVEVEAMLHQLRSGGYREVVAPAVEEWEGLKEAIAREQALVAAGRIEAADTLRMQVVQPAFTAVAARLDPIGAAINQAGEAEVRRAQIIAQNASTTTLLALATALAVSLLVAYVLTRVILRPIEELRRGMGAVAEGEFDPRMSLQTDRPDEIGDLNRSFMQMTAQLAELDRLKAEFISIASHELKTPLSVIRGYVSLLLDGVYGELPDQHSKVLSSVSDQTYRLGRLIEQLLDISRFEAGGGRVELRPIDLDAFLSELATSFEALAMQNDIHFRLEASESLPDEIVGDPDRLNEVVGNLLSNAFKFTPRGGEILLRSIPEEDGIVIEVTDTGVGIPGDKLPMIFEKFFQVDNEAQPRSAGSGLGLAIAQEIVEAHGGTIAAESKLGVGTTFRIELPTHPVTAATSAESPGRA